MNSVKLLYQTLPRGTRVAINSQRLYVEGTVFSAQNFGNALAPDWYIEIEDDDGNYRYWKQGIDGGDVEILDDDGYADLGFTAVALSRGREAYEDYQASIKAENEAYERQQQAKIGHAAQTVATQIRQELPKAFADAVDVDSLIEAVEAWILWHERTRKRVWIDVKGTTPIFVEAFPYLSAGTVEGGLVLDDENRVVISVPVSWRVEEIEDSLTLADRVETFVDPWIALGRAQSVAESYAKAKAELMERAKDWKAPKALVEASEPKPKRMTVEDALAAIVYQLEELNEHMDAVSFHMPKIGN